MALVGAIRILLALPLDLAGRLAGFVSPPLRAALYKAAWRVNGQGQTALRALQAVSADRGPGAARETAEVWMRRRPSPEIAAFAGLQALRQDDRRAAADWLARGRESGRDALGNMELLEFLVAMFAGPAEASRLANEFASRRDLPPTVSKLVLARLMWDDLFAGRPEGARQRALRLLAVDDDRDAACILWALDSQQGRGRAAEDHLRRAGPVATPWLLYVQIHACAALGLEDQVGQFLAELEGLDPEAAQAARRDLAGRRGGG